MVSQALESARELLPLLEAHRDETEAGRCLAPTIVQALRESGLARMTVVEPLGGLEASTPEALEVYELLAGIEASASWIVWNNSLPCLFSRYLKPTAREEIFGDSSFLFANSTRPSGMATPESGGFRVSGRWALVSGCELAEWLALMCIVRDPNTPANGPPDMRFVFVQRDQCQILDTWHVGGLRGTGSHDVTVEDVLVPESRTLGPFGSEPTLDRPIARVPIAATLASGFAAQALGVARASLAVVEELARTKITPEPVPDLRDRPTAQGGFAESAVATRAARAQLFESVGSVWSKAEHGDPIDVADVSRLWSASLFADQVSERVVNTMYAIGGTTSIYTSCPLERAHRDLHAMMRHVIAQPMWLEDAGRVAFGLHPNNPLYLI